MRGRELRGQPVGHTPSVAGAAPRRNRVTPCRTGHPGARSPGASPVS